MFIHTTFDKSKVLHHLKHFLPSQSPFKRILYIITSCIFFNIIPFMKPIIWPLKFLAIKTYPNIFEYRKWFHEGKIDENIIRETIIQHKGQENLDEYFFSVTYMTTLIFPLKED
ncbi:MAG: hypothetical protein KatS3mg027_2301 [Bacteroidia bacterium]|nr:MAG: hypothetical protein KatS3mg027_2301 [Bacteroidia bacterium]